jgi:branched-chain amino acid transport system permease protein
MASVSGSLTVHYLRVMEPHVFDFAYSLNIVTAVIAGGLTSIWGGAVGATIFIAVREAVRGLGIPYLETIVMGVLTCFVLILFPRGFVGALSDIFSRLFSRPARMGVARAARAPIGAVAGPAIAADPAPLLEVIGAEKAFGSLRAVGNVSFAVPHGSITALIGPNGAGKTTLFNLINGHLPLAAGTVRFAGRDISRALPEEIAALAIARTFQNLQLFETMTVIENVMCGRHRLATAGIVEIVARVPRVAREEARIRAAAEHWLDFVGLGREVGSLSPAALPFGHRRLVEIARAMALEPVLLLMDEPASGLNDTETERLGELLLRINAGGTTILLVEHDIRLVFGVSDHVVVLHHGEKIAAGAPAVIRRDPQVVAAYLGH